MSYIISWVHVASFYREFIRGFAHIVLLPLFMPSLKSLRSGTVLGQCEEACMALKEKLTSPSILPFPRFNWNSHWTRMQVRRTLVLFSLMQDNDRQVVAYASWVLTKTERQYCATRREMLALVYCEQCSILVGPSIFGPDRPCSVRMRIDCVFGCISAWLMILCCPFVESEIMRH